MNLEITDTKKSYPTQSDIAIRLFNLKVKNHDNKRISRIIKKRTS